VIGYPPDSLTLIPLHETTETKLSRIKNSRTSAIGQIFNTRNPRYARYAPWDCTLKMSVERQVKIYPTRVSFLVTLEEPTSNDALSPDFHAHAQECVHITDVKRLVICHYVTSCRCSPWLVIAGLLICSYNLYFCKCTFISIYIYILCKRIIYIYIYIYIFIFIYLVLLFFLS